jgi:hypothetical protein
LQIELPATSLVTTSIKKARRVARARVRARVVVPYERQTSKRGLFV